MGISVDTSELVALNNEIKRSAERVGAAASAALRKSAYDIERRAKVRCPVAKVNGGTLRNSISTSIEGDGRSVAMSAEIGPTANYGWYVEAGTYKMAPRPYLAPAWDEVVPGFMAAMGEAGEMGLR